MYNRAHSTSSQLYDCGHKFSDEWYFGFSVTDITLYLGLCQYPGILSHENQFSINSCFPDFVR